MVIFSRTSVRLLLGCFFMFLIASCKKEAETPKTVTDTSALSTLKAVYAPFELVTIKTPKNALGNQALDGMLDGQKVRLVAADTLAVFVMPDVANGAHTLTLTANGKEHALKVGVLALTNVLGPDVYFNALEAQTTRNLTTINAQADALLLGGGPAAAVQALKQNAQQYATQLATHKTTYQGLSASQKQDFARAMAANKADDDEYEGLAAGFASQASALRGMQTVPDYEAGVNISIRTFIRLVFTTFIHIPAIELEAQVLVLSDPFTKAAVLLALGITVTSFMVHLSLTLSAVGILFNKAFKPAQDLDVDQTSYNNGTDMPVNVSAQYRSLNQADETSGAGGSIVDACLAQYKQFRDAFNGMAAKLPSALRPTPIATVLRAQASRVLRNVYNGYVRVSNVSNSAVTLLLLNQSDGSLKVRATTTAATTQAFSYDLQYVNSEFSTGLAKRVSAQVTAGNNSTTNLIGTYNGRFFPVGGGFTFFIITVNQIQGSTVTGSLSFDISSGPISGVLNGNNFSFTPSGSLSNWRFAGTVSTDNRTIEGSGYSVVPTGFNSGTFKVDK